MHESNDIHSNPSQKLQIHISGSKNNKCSIFQKYFLISKITHWNISSSFFWFTDLRWTLPPTNYAKASNLFIRRFWRSKTHLSQTTHTLRTPEEKGARDEAPKQTQHKCIFLEPGHEVPLKELIPIFDANLKMDVFKNYLNILEPQVYWMSYLR